MRSHAGRYGELGIRRGNGLRSGWLSLNHTGCYREGHRYVNDAGGRYSKTDMASDKAEQAKGEWNSEVRVE